MNRRRLSFIFSVIAAAANGLSPSAQSGTTSPPTIVVAPTEKDCCLCVYDDQRDYKQTERFRNGCSDWQTSKAAPHGCSVALSYSLTNWKASNLPVSCDKISMVYKGHSGEKNGDICSLFGACTKNSPHCSSFDYDSYACSVFRNDKIADDIARKLWAQLPSGCTAQVSANMSNGLTYADSGLEVPNTSSRLSYTITRSCIARKYSDCNTSGSECDLDAGGNPNFSCLDQGLLKIQKCCLDPTQKKSQSKLFPGKWINPGEDCLAVAEIKNPPPAPIKPAREPIPAHTARAAKP